MTRRALGFEAPPSIAVAEGATTPDPGIVGVRAWSTTLSAPVHWDGTQWTAGASGGSGGAALSLYDEWDDTNFGIANAVTPPFAGAAISTGTMSTALPAAALNGKNWNGVFLRSSTTANGGYKYQTTSLVSMYFGQKSAKWVGMWRHRTQFTGVTVRAGFHDSATSADAVDGAYFELAGAVASAKTAANSVRTTNATTYTLALDVDYTFDIEVNAAGTSARFRIYANGGATPVLDVTNTANIPATSARTFGAGIVATESSTTALDMLILYYMGFGTAEGYAAARSATPGPQGPMGPKSINLPDPTATEKVVLFKADAALTVSSLSAVLPGASGGQSVTYSIRYGADVSAAGTEVVTGGSTVTSVTTGDSPGALTAPSIPAGSWVWLTTTAKAGTVPTLVVSIGF